MKVTGKITFIVCALLLLTSGMSLGAGNIRQSTAGYKVIMQKIAACNLLERGGAWLMEQTIPKSSNKTVNYRKIAEALNNSPVFRTYTVVLVDAPSLQAYILQDFVQFLSNPHKEVPSVMEGEAHVYKFFFARSGQQVWARVNILERRVYVGQASIRDATKEPVLHYIVPNSKECL